MSWLYLLLIPAVYVKGPTCPCSLVISSFVQLSRGNDICSDRAIIYYQAPASCHDRRAVGGAAYSQQQEAGSCVHIDYYNPENIYSLPDLNYYYSGWTKSIQLFVCMQCSLYSCQVWHRLTGTGQLLKSPAPDEYEAECGPGVSV